MTGAPRAATNPVNALLNYTYALLESEARLALLAAGLDLTLVALHGDQRNRDSFALDTMEPVRPDVDAFLLDLLEDRVFTSRDFVELSNGVCRVAAPLSHELALTLPHWRECLRPIAASLAQTFRESLAQGCAAPRTLAAKSGNKRRSVPSAERSPLLATPRKASQPQPYATRKWRTPPVEARPSTPTACALCGEPVLKRRRRHCEACMPKARREHGLRAIEAARKTLAAQTAAGNDPRRSPVVNAARGEAISEGHRRNRRWAREHPGQRDEDGFKREIAPKLDGFSLKEIAAATGLSLAACSRIRAGVKVPHPRHWGALLSMLGGVASS
ncbi:MAG: CRISPR-associated endonuclease Cas1 [Candidatus Cybelea sp.]